MARSVLLAVAKDFLVDGVNIVGALMEAWCGSRREGWVNHVFQSGSRDGYRYRSRPDALITVRIEHEAIIAPALQKSPNTTTKVSGTGSAVIHSPLRFMMPGRRAVLEEGATVIRMGETPNAASPYPRVVGDMDDGGG